MDPPDPLLITPDPAVTGHDATSDVKGDSPGLPSVRPTRKALDFLEQALTTGVPKPSYHGTIRRFSMAHGKYATDEAFTLPLLAPSHTAQSMPSLHLALKYRSLSFEPDPDPDSDTCSPADVSKISAKDVQDSKSTAPQARDTLKGTTDAQSPPQGTFTRPKPRGVVQKGDASRAQSQPQSKGAANTKRRNNTGGPRRAVKFQLPQGETESAPSETAQARSRLMVTIKSHAAARKWEELEKEKR